MQKKDRWLRRGHVMVNRDDVEAVRTERFQHRLHLAREHRDVAGDRGLTPR
jgi:hypothetical protein